MDRSLEEGEVYDPTPSHSDSVPQDYSYDPSYEWPGEPDLPGGPSPHPESSMSPQPPTKKFRPNQPSFRLIVMSSSILPSRQKLAVIDGHSEVQFGRDVPPVGSVTPKIRLKEMEVSKIHATAYWDASRYEWSIVDMGSVHGTFLRPASATGDVPGVRLSPSRQASIPRTLKHKDRLTIGGTSFLVHIHRDQLPCEECWLSGKEEIPLFPVTKSSKAATPVGRFEPPSDPGASSGKDVKKALTMLKQSLLAQHQSPASQLTRPVDSVTQYVDRSARRRALMPASQLDSPGIASAHTWTEPQPPRPKSPNPEPVSQPPTPVPTSNVGHRLLMKQGWEPGTALGSELDGTEARISLLEPLEISANGHRVGLGLKREATPDASNSLDWRESGKRRRWN